MAAMNDALLTAATLVSVHSQGPSRVRFRELAPSWLPSRDDVTGW
jgi:hypothetical protein